MSEARPEWSARGLFSPDLLRTTFDQIRTLTSGPRPYSRDQIRRLWALPVTLSETAVSLTTRVLEFAAARRELRGKPGAWVAAAIYLACNILGEPVGQDRVAEWAGVTTPAVRGRYWSIIGSRTGPAADFSECFLSFHKPSPAPPVRRVYGSWPP